MFNTKTAYILIYSQYESELVNKILLAYCFTAYIIIILQAHHLVAGH